MGWLSTARSSMGPHTTAKAYLDTQFTAERTRKGGPRGLRVLASSCVGSRVYYDAAQQIDNGILGNVVAIVCLVRWNPHAADGYLFGYKDMEETMGPCEAGCPEHILALLSPTDHEAALDWRRRCLANLARRRRPLEHGTRIRLAQPLTFTDGHVGDEFTVEKGGGGWPSAPAIGPPSTGSAVSGSLPGRSLPKPKSTPRCSHRAHIPARQVRAPPPLFFELALAPAVRAL